MAHLNAKNNESQLASQPTGLGTALMHADARFADEHVAPAISVTSTFRSTDIDEPPLGDLDGANPAQHVYSRYTQNVSTRVEKVLGALHGTSSISSDGTPAFTPAHAITYSSGLSAAFAALVYLSPKRIALSEGYYGVVNTIRVFGHARGAEIPLIGVDEEYQEGDIAWVETPMNPTGEAKDIKYYADKIHRVGGRLVVDSTFAPPPLQNALLWGADVVMHSATKYFGGHSDLLSGVLVVPTVKEWRILWDHRTYLGNTMGSLESWLLLRSMRTLHLRIPRQSQSATALATWLHSLTKIPEGQMVDGVPGGVVKTVRHASLQDKTLFDPTTQLTGGYSPTFAILLAHGAQGKALGHRLHLFTYATSLGGVESLIEWRKRSDPRSDPRLMRLSIGVEDVEDLKNDLRQGLVAVKDLKGSEEEKPNRSRE